MTAAARIRAAASPDRTLPEIARIAGVHLETAKSRVWRDKLPFKRAYTSDDKEHIHLRIPVDLMDWLREDAPDGKPVARHIRDILIGVKRDSERKVRE